MQKNYLMAILLLLCNCLIYAQQPYNKRSEFLKANSVWAFGPKSGLDFSSGKPLPIISAIPGEGAASACDPVTGKLLFYTDGVTVWNANHKIMPNGNGLYGVVNGQRVCIVPFIEDPNKYYIFNMLGFNSGKKVTTGDLHYSVVDMELDNGLGDLDTNRKNMPLAQNITDTFSSGIIAIPGDNCDVWLMTHNYGKSVFKAYNITKNGIDNMPVISAAGHLNISKVPISFIGVYYSGSYYHSTMSVSSDRKRIFISSMDFLAAISGQAHPLMNGSLICKFDPKTGIVSDAIEIDNDLMVGGEATFSPDNTKLYLQNIDVLKGSQIHQYDIGNHDSIAIVGSRSIIADSLGSLIFTTFKLYNDTIYMRSTDRGIGQITRPNLSGSASDLQLGQKLATDAASISLYSGLVYPYPPDTNFTLLLDTLLCKDWDNGILLIPSIANDGYDYLWSDGSLDTSLKVFAQGKYWVQYNDGCHFKIDSFVIKGEDLVPPIIRINVNELSTSISYEKYQWYIDGSKIPEATNSKYTVSKNGDYQVEVQSKYGCIGMSDMYFVRNFTSVENIYNSYYLGFYPNPAKNMIKINAPNDFKISVISLEGKIILEKVNNGDLDISNLSEGVYLIKILDTESHFYKIEKLVIKK